MDGGMIDDGSMILTEGERGFNTWNYILRAAGSWSNQLRGRHSVVDPLNLTQVILAEGQDNGAFIPQGIDA